MKMTRRGLITTLGIGTAASLLAGAGLTARSAQAQTREAALAGVYDNGIMQLNQNESARGPGPKTLEAMRAHANHRIGRGYFPDHVNELQAALADTYGLTTRNILLATGSTPLLEGAVHAFCSAERPLATVGPTYATSEGTARALGYEIRSVPVDSSMAVDLSGLAAAAKGAGLVYFCNPNNPTGTVHAATAVESFVRQIMRDSPDTHILIDEAYIAYVAPSLMQTALPLTAEFANVFITRSFSKAHGLAGMRIGYAMGQEATLRNIQLAWGMGDVSMLAAVAAVTALQDKDHLDWEREENAQIRAFTTAALRELGCTVPDSQTNHLFVNLHRSAPAFRDACLAQKIQLGRDFPPFQETHTRISLGSREEMQIAVEVFRKVLSA